jgi:hypothetical protein
MASFLGRDIASPVPLVACHINETIPGVMVTLLRHYVSIVLHCVAHLCAHGQYS